MLLVTYNILLSKYMVTIPFIQANEKTTKMD